MSNTHAGGGPSLLTLAAFAACAFLVAVAADLMQPLGPFALVLTLTFAGAALVSGLLSLFPPTRALFGGLLMFCLIALAMFGGLFGLQRFATPATDGVRNGVLTTVVSPARDFQRLLIREAPLWDGRPAPQPPPAEPAAAPEPPPLPAAQAALQKLTASLASPDPAERLRGGVEALAEKEPAVVAAVIDKLYRSADPAVRQLAVKRLMAQRRGTRIPILAVAANPESEAFANALQGVGVTVRSINETSGAFDGGLCAASGMSGAVNRTGVTIATRCKVGDAERNTVLVLQAADDFQLKGEARNDQGQTARVELPLM
ncbi:MAG: hypothetical protein NW200_01620 [Hyphomonadaceae bacterium]|nr:hypothetical protein [Hyphomonadaceae bacterium]